MPMNFFRSCVQWPQGEVPALSRMIEGSRRISRRTFLRHVNRTQLADIERELGYGPHLHMAADHCVSYHRSTLRGRRCYYFRWSAIEYVFI